MVRALIALAIAGAALAQSFEVVSIKPYQGTFLFCLPLTRNGPLVNYSGCAVRDLVREAYNLKYDSQIDGVTGWIGNERFDISGRVAGEGIPTPDELRPMLRALLAERFSLKAHREIRETPVYALVVAKGGAKIKEHTPPETGGGLRPDRNGGAVTVMKFTNSPLDTLVSVLTLSGDGRPVLDKTGLMGKYDFEFSYVQDPATHMMTGPSGESLFTILEEKLGLKLEAQKAPIEVVVIDSVARPSEN